MQAMTQEQANDSEVTQYSVTTKDGEFLIERGLYSLGKREHPLEVQIAQMETQKLGFHALEYEAYINVFNEAKSLVGGLQLQRRWNVAKLYSLWIDENIRGQGLGSHLMQEAESLTLAMGANIITLETSDIHHFQFYLNHGFVIFHQTQDVIPNTRYYFMNKTI